jgi:hypothetical protein
MPEQPKDEQPNDERSGNAPLYRSLSTSIAVIAVPVAIVAAPVAGAVAEHVLDGRKPEDESPTPESEK